MAEIEEGTKTKKEPMFRAYIKVFAVIALVLLVGLGCAAHFAKKLPREVVHSASMVIAQPQAKVWNTLRNPETYPNWQKGMRDVRPQAQDSEGITDWIQTWDHNTEHATLLSRAIPDTLKVRMVANRNVSYSDWTWALEPVPPDSTRVTLIARTTLQAPMLRIWQHFVPMPQQDLAPLLQALANVR